jgi:hypothetical protein
MENMLVKLEMSEMVIEEKMEGIDEKNMEVMKNLHEKIHVNEKNDITKKSSTVKFVKPPFG